MGPKAGICVVCGRADDGDDHRDEDNLIKRCPTSEAFERGEKSVYLRDLGMI